MNLKTIDLALVLHNHQPVGNKHEIVEKVYNSSYLPFLKLLATHPEIRVNVHYSGFLLEWLEQYHGEFVELLRSLVERGNLEIIGGGYYEPIIATIPDADAVGQANLLRKTINRLFHRVPNGFWVAERAWEPHLPEILVKCGAKYTLLDDDIFAGSGIFESKCFSPYHVESRGSQILVFPMLKQLRFLMPFRPARRTIEYLREHASFNSPIAVSADDGEKFGAWPNTYDQVYMHGWLEGFFKLVEQNKSWLQMVRLSDRLSDSTLRSRIYLGSSSYPELMQWSIPNIQKPKSVRTRGFWRLFLAKYPESARLYLKMLRTSKFVQKPRIVEFEAVRELWKGQCNDAYWHGIFGGLYSPVLRRLTYSHLIKAQCIAETKMKTATPRWESIRVNGSNELLINTRSIGAHVCPEIGGAMAELDHKQSNTNLFDTITRRPETYHRLIKKNANRSTAKEKKIRSIHDAPRLVEDGLKSLLTYDRRERLSFMDHLFAHYTKSEDYESQSQVEEADLSSSYDYGIQEKSEGIQVALSKRARTRDDQQIQVVKKIMFPNAGSRIEACYQVALVKGNALSSKFGVELNIGSLADDEFIHLNSKKKILLNVNKFSLIHPKIGLKSNIVIDRKSQLWQFPIRTVSQTESGFESNLQGVCLIISHDVDLRRNETSSIKFEIEAVES